MLVIAAVGVCWRCGDAVLLCLVNCVQGYVPIPLPKYFTSEWSFAQYKLTEEDTGRSLVGFSSTDPHSIIIITQSGRYHKVSFDPQRGGPCVQQAFGCYIVEGEEDGS